jgi:capsular exopolysaccharide synthesis family protein
MGIGALGLLPKVRDAGKALSFQDRHSAFSEAVASIRALLRMNMRQGTQVVMVTSALPQEGKTFFSSSLARNAAMAGERVLLIDCDLRRPAVARTIALSTRASENAGEIDAPTDLAIRRDAISSLDVMTLPSGARSPQDLFASPRMRETITALRERYDLIVLDAPPVLAVSDARVLSALSDVTVMVVRWQKTPQQHVTTAICALRASGARVAGAVITQVRMNKLGASDGSYAYVQRKYPGYVQR